MIMRVSIHPKTISGKELFESINIPLSNTAQDQEIRSYQIGLEKTRAKEILEIESLSES